MYKPVILPLARNDKEAALWYNDQLPGLGKRFLASVKKSTLFICQNPKAVAIRYGDTRTILIDTFPYLIHFSVMEKSNEIVISAVLSTSRSPKLWKRDKV